MIKSSKQPSKAQKGPKKGMKLHQFIATGGKPKDFKGCKGVNSSTVPGAKESY